MLDSCRVLWDAVNIVKDNNAELAIREYTGDSRETPTMSRYFFLFINPYSTAFC